MSWPFGASGAFHLPSIGVVGFEPTQSDSMTEAALSSSAALELDKVAPFLIKLFEIVSSPASDNLVCWSEYGDSFKIVDRSKFAQVAPAPADTTEDGHQRRLARPTRADMRATHEPRASSAAPAPRSGGDCVLVLATTTDRHHPPSSPCPQDVLPLYFKHDNLRSFIRQLNIYGFQRVPNASGRDRTMEFQHAMFTRNGIRNLKVPTRRAPRHARALCARARTHPTPVASHMRRSRPRWRTSLIARAALVHARAQEIKRGTQSKSKQENDEGDSGDYSSELPPAKKPRQDYSVFQSDVARLQQNLNEFEQDLKEHTMHVRWAERERRGAPPRWMSRAPRTRKRARVALGEEECRALDWAR